METEPVINLALEAPRNRHNEALSVVAHAVRGTLETGAFYDLLLSRAMEAMQAVAAAIWEVDADGQLTLARGVNFDETGLLKNAEAQSQHDRVLRKLVSGGPPEIVAARDEHDDLDADSGNPTEFSLLLGPLMIDQGVDGVLEVFQPPEVPRSIQEGQLRFMLQLCGFGSDYLRTAKIRHLVERQALSDHVDTFVQEIHRSLDRKRTCYAIANEGRRLIECDRLSVAVKRGRHFVVEAVSGQDTLNPRAAAIAALNRLASTVAAAGDAVWYAGDTIDLPPQVEEAVQAYVDASNSVTVAAIPLRRIAPPTADATADNSDAQAEPIVGVLIAETFQDWDFSEPYRRRVALASAHSSAALANAVEHRSLFLMPVWHWLGRLPLVTKARAFPKIAVIAAALVGALVALCFIPMDFELSGKGTLEPVVKRNVFADLSGTVTEIKADRGHVQAGDPLATIDSPDVKEELLRLQGERDSKLQEQMAKDRMVKEGKLTEAERMRTWSEIEGLEAQLANLGKQIQLVSKEKVARAEVVSPIDGDIITWQVREKLDHRPVEKGQVLLTVAALDQAWNLEIRLPEDRVGHLREAIQELPPGEPMSVSFILASDPGTRHHGTVKEIHGRAEVHGDDGNVVLVRVAIDKDEIKDLRPGAGVTAKFYCGRRSVAFVWFHDVWAFIQAKVLF